MGELGIIGPCELERLQSEACFRLRDGERDGDRIGILGGEAAVEPSAGHKVGDRTWSAATVPPDDIMVFGTAEMPWLDLAKAVGFQRTALG